MQRCKGEKHCLLSAADNVDQAYVSFGTAFNAHLYLLKLNEVRGQKGFQVGGISLWTRSEVHFVATHYDRNFIVYFDDSRQPNGAKFFDILKIVNIVNQYHDIAFLNFAVCLLLVSFARGRIYKHGVDVVWKKVKVRGNSHCFEYPVHVLRKAVSHDCVDYGCLAYALIANEHNSDFWSLIYFSHNL